MVVMYSLKVSRGRRNRFGYNFYSIGVFWCVVAVLDDSCGVIVPVGEGVEVTRLVVPPRSMLVLR